jgi:hypothetical protein
VPYVAVAVRSFRRFSADRAATRAAPAWRTVVRHYTSPGAELTHPVRGCADDEAALSTSRLLDRHRGHRRADGGPQAVQEGDERIEVGRRDPLPVELREGRAAHRP